MSNDRLSARAQKVFELALREALQLGCNYIGTEHILLALIREGEGVAAKVLTDDLGVELNVARKAVIQRLSAQQQRPSELDLILKQLAELTERVTAMQAVAS